MLRTKSSPRFTVFSRHDQAPEASQTGAARSADWIGHPQGSPWTSLALLAFGIVGGAASMHGEEVRTPCEHHV